MASTVVAPPASAPVAAAPSAPASATPVSTPTPSPAPVETPTPAPTGPLDGGEISLGDRLAQAWAKVKAEPIEGEVSTPETPAPAAAPPAPETVPPAAPAEGEVKTAAEVEKPAAAAPELTFAPEDFEDGLAPADFAKAISTDPAVTKFFDGNPAVKGQVFAALRRDAENRELRQIIPDMDTAKTVVGAAGTYQRFDNAFLSATTPESAQGFLNHWMKEAQIVGEDGKPVLKDGVPQFHPALGAILRKVRDDGLSWLQKDVEATGKLPAELTPFLDALQKHATQSGNERLQAAVSALREEAGSAPSSPSDTLPDELKPYADKLKADRAALDKEKTDAARQREESAKVVNQQSIDRAETTAVDALFSQLRPKFTEAGLSKAEMEWTWKLFSDKLDAALIADPLYEPLYQSILLEEPGDARETKLRKHILKYAAPKAPRLLTGVLRDVKSGAVTRQTDKETKVEDQRRTSATDPRGTSIAPSSPTTQTPLQMRTEIVEAYIYRKIKIPFRFGRAVAQRVITGRAPRPKNCTGGWSCL
jgi:hypothetical protein